ncbi:hypothetical protein Mapa_017040 [Marchantia paleacea]|nr:hypothetical protein Mapa_017040 [Marchantia paleacea]
MKKATLWGTSVTTAFYMSVAISGYLAFGDATPGNLLTGFFTPYWLVDFANVCIVIHLIGAYQVCISSYDHKLPFTILILKVVCLRSDQQALEVLIPQNSLGSVSVLLDVVTGSSQMH